MTDSDKKRQGGPRLTHPLAGANFWTLFRVLTRNGFVPARYLPHVALMFGSALGRLPFTLTERALFAYLRRKAGPIPAPIFIVGHWRSGTTHLYNVMSKAPDFGFIPPIATGLPWDMLTIGKLFRPFLEKALPKDRFIDNIPVKPDSPQEDEIGLANMVPTSFYHGLYFPSHFRENFYKGIFFDGCTASEIAEWKRIFVYYLEKISIQQKGKRLLIKNPVYTARVKMIREIWPDAKFIHIHRNPFVVFHSMRNFYVKLFREMALQDYAHVDIDEFILETYPRIMQTLEQERVGLPQNQFIEVKFEEFEQEPIEGLRRIYDTLDLDGFARDLPYFEAYLKTITSYKKNVYDFPDETSRKIAERWAPLIEQGGYTPPHLGAPAA